jgi:hypothetical protein
VSLVALFVVGVAGFAVTPRLGFWLAGAEPPRTARWLPWLSAVLFAVAWILPNPALAHTSTFTQHAVGGGAASAVAGLFIALNMGLRSSVLRIGFAYAVAASLGVGIELLELLYDQLRHTNLTADSAWDLLANTTGAVLMALALEGLVRISSRSTRPATAIP